MFSLSIHGSDLQQKLCFCVVVFIWITILHETCNTNILIWIYSGRTHLFQCFQTHISNQMSFSFVSARKIQIQAPVGENLKNKSISEPPLTPSPAPLPDWLPVDKRSTQTTCDWSRQVPVIGGAPGSGSGQQRRAAAPLLWRLVRRAAKGSGVRASSCASVDQTAAAAVRFSSSRAAGIPGNSRAVHAADGRRRRILLCSSSLSFWLIETYIFFISLMRTNTERPETCGIIWRNCSASL